jgi:sugar lactone lactonase YvrE
MSTNQRAALHTFRSRRRRVAGLVATAASLIVGLFPAVGRADILYVTYETNKVERFTPNGVGTDFGPTGFNTQPEGLAFDPAGNLYVANFGNHVNTIVKFTPGGVRTTFADELDGVNAPIGLAFDAQGRLYAANARGQTIERFDVATGVGTVLTSTLPYAPTGLAFDAAGNLYIATQANNVIQRLTPAGALSAFTTVSTLPNSLAGLAIDGAGNLYVADANAHKIDKINLATGILSVFADAADGLDQPIGLAFDSAGDLYVANQGSNTIERFTPAGIGSLFATTGRNGPQYLAFTNDAGVPLIPAGPAPTATPLPSPLALGLAGCLGAMLAARAFGQRRVFVRAA